MTATATAPTRTLSRDDLIRLGSAGRPWEFLGPALAGLAIEPADEELRLLAMANATMLGLGTVARGQVDSLSARALRRADVKTMLARLDSLKPDEVSFESRLSTLRSNVEALAHKDVHLGDLVERWREQDRGRRWFRALDGNMPRLREGVWEKLADHVGLARRFSQSHLDQGGEAARPTIVEGIDPPWLLIELDRVMPAEALGHSARLTVVQADAMELLDGLAHVDLTALLSAPRFRAFVGLDGSERLDAELRSRFESQIVGPVIPLAGVRTRVTPSIESVMTRAESDQQGEHQELMRIVRSMYEGRDAAWWAQRYRSAGTEPLRVLVPTCRYSTFIQHSASDLVRAFQDAGWHAELLIEPDATSHLSSLAYLRTIERLQPDLVVLINYTRAHLGEVFPPELPFVCWLQDAMGHHYDAAAGASQTELDFLVGHVPQELFTQFGFPRERVLRMPVVASARTFHDDPVEPAAQRRFECEIAWVSHHSEDPAAMHERLKDEVGWELAPLLDELQPAVDAIARGSLDEKAGVKLREATEAVVGKGPGASDAITTQLFRLYARPLADRIFRHQTLEWAADIADRRHWRLHIHGRGWEDHPRFGRYAAGEVAHDDDLRGCYQCAHVHLHMTFSNLVHQRIMECALSGGLPLCRISSDSLVPLLRALRIAATQGDPVQHDDSGSEAMVGFDVEATAESAALAAMIRRAGAEVSQIQWARKRHVDQRRTPPLPPPERRADWLLGDLGQMTFSSADSLESLIERAITDRDWRRSRVEHVASRVRERLTDDAFVTRVHDLVMTSLGAR